MANWWDKYESEPAEKPDRAWWRKYEEEEKTKPYSRRGSVEARNKQAEPDILSKRAQRFQLGNELDAELPAFMGRGEDMLAHPERVKAAAAQVRPDLPTGVDAASYERFMDAESGGMGIVPGTGRSMEDAVVVGQNLGVIGAKFREGWRTTKAGAAADEYLRTGRITVGTTPGVGDVDYPVYLEGDAAEKYVRDLASTTNDTALVEAFDKQVGAGARALTSTLAQPEQLLSIPGGIVGTAVGQPTLGAAVGALPSTIKGYYSELLANLQAGVSPELARANALAGAGVDFATETLGGRFGAHGGVLPAAGISATEEAGAELGRMGSDYAFSFADERFGSKLPKTFGEGVERVTEAGIAGGLGAGISAAREMLAKAGGISDGRPDVAQPKASPSSVDAPINIAPFNTDTVEAPSTTGINIEGAKRDSVNPDGDSKKREIPAKEDTLSTAPLSAVQLTPADAGTIIDTRLSSLREASQRNRLDEGTVKTLQREDEELRLTLQEDEKRKAAGILQTPERPYLSDNARNLISQKRAEVRERLEQHRAAVGYGNELRDLETRLSKLGESDSDFVALADSLVRGQGASVSRAQQQMAPVASQNQSQDLPATPVAPAAVEAPVASQEAVTNVPDAAPAVPVSNVVQSPVTSTQVPSVSNTQQPTTTEATTNGLQRKEKGRKRKGQEVTQKTVSEGDALAQAFTELQQKSVSDPAFQKQVTDNPSLMRQMATKRAAEIVAASKGPKAPAAPVVEETPTLDMATPAPNKPRYESKDAFLTELYSGVGDKEATEAKKIADNIVVYDGDADLAGIDPEVATKVQEAVQKQGATGARPKAFQYKGKVYFNMEGVRPGEAKSTFLHEARVHLAAKAEPARVSALASRVVALAKAGDATAQAAAKTVAKEYPGVTQSAKEGNESAKDLSREELLADFAQRVYDRVKSGQGVSGTIKRLYSDVMSYLRDLYTTAAKKLFGERFALNITDVDILDAVRYGRTAAGFKGEAKPTALAEAAQKAKDETPAMALTSDTIKPDTGGVELPQGTIEQRIGERIQSWTAPVISPKGTGSTSAKLMGEKAIGISNEQRLAAEVLAVDLKKQMAKELAKGMKKLPEHARARYAFRVGQALAGDATILDELPKDIRNTVEAMRRMLDDNSLRLIAIGAVPASKIRTLLNNQGKWLHRDFDVFHHDPREYREKVQAMARAGEDIISPLLPDIEKELQLPDADVLQTIADMLVTKGGKKDWRKESMEKLRKVTGEPTPKRGATPKTNKAVRDAAEEYLRDMAAKWGIGRNTKMDGKDGIVARLIELSKNGDIRAAASRYANSLLDPKAGYNDAAPYIPSVMGIDDSSLDKRRKKVPEWMQTLWGRFQDPVAMFLTSVDNHANVIAKFTALAEYKARGMANGTVLENKEGMTDYNLFPKGFVLLQKENDPLYYGPLNGMWVKQKDMDYLGVTASQRMAEKMLSQGIGPKFFRPYSLLMQPVKMMQIAADHTSFIINAVSAVFMMSRANPFTTIPRGLKAARYTALGGTRFGKALNDSAFNSDVNAMIRQGLLVNNALAGEARRKLRELIMEPGERFLPTPVKFMNKLKRAGGKVSDSLSRALSFFDEAGKVMMVYARMKDLEAIYPDKSRDEIREIAIEHAMQTMPVASREAPIARMAGNSGVANVYATFYAAMIRNTYNHLKLADEYSGMDSPAAKRYAFAEMALLSLKALGMYTLTKTGIAVFGYMYSGSDDDDEDEREKAAKAQQEHYDELRAMHPEYQQGDVLYTRESEPDVFHFLSAQRYDPLPFGALAAASARGDENEKMNLLVSYLFSDSPILEPLSNVIGYGVQTAAGEITEPDSFSLSAKERFMKGAEELLKAGVPGAWKRFEKQYKSDDEATPFEMFANNVGFTHGVLDLRKETGNAAAGYLAIINSLKKDAGKRVSTEDGVFFDAKADFVGDVTARAEAWRIARRKISAMQKYGKSDDWIEEAIASNPYTSSMSKDEVESLLDGVFRVPDYKEWLDRQYEIDIADPKNARRLDEVEEQYALYGKELQQFEEGLADLLKGMEVEYY